MFRLLIFLPTYHPLRQIELYLLLIILRRSNSETKSTRARMGYPKYPCKIKFQLLLVSSKCLCRFTIFVVCFRTDLSCGRPPRVSNARPQYPATNFSSVVTYVCNEGHTLSGAAKRTCRANGRWDGVGPNCCEYRLVRCVLIDFAALKLIFFPLFLFSKNVFFTNNSIFYVHRKARKLHPEIQDW